MAEFTAEDFAFTAQRLRHWMNADRESFQAVASNNLSVILAALDAAATANPTGMVAFYDTDTDTANIALLGSYGPGEIVKTVGACDDHVKLGFNAAGQLIVIDLLDMDMLHPGLARNAIQMRLIEPGDLA